MIKVQEKRKEETGREYISALLITSVLSGGKNININPH